MSVASEACNDSSQSSDSMSQSLLPQKQYDARHVGVSDTAPLKKDDMRVEKSDAASQCVLLSSSDSDSDKQSEVLVGNFNMVAEADRRKKQNPKQNASQATSEQISQRDAKNSSSNSPRSADLLDVSPVRSSMASAALARSSREKSSNGAVTSHSLTPPAQEQAVAEKPWTPNTKNPQHTPQQSEASSSRTSSLQASSSGQKEVVAGMPSCVKQKQAKFKAPYAVVVIKSAQSGCNQLGTLPAHVSNSNAVICGTSIAFAPPASQLASTVSGNLSSTSAVLSLSRPEPTPSNSRPPHSANLPRTIPNNIPQHSADLGLPQNIPNAMPRQSPFTDTSKSGGNNMAGVEQRAVGNGGAKGQENRIGPKSTSSQQIGLGGSSNTAALVVHNSPHTHSLVNPTTGELFIILG
jgi:hypothetical protein